MCIHNGDSLTCKKCNDSYKSKGVIRKGTGWNKLKIISDMTISNYINNTRGYSKDKLYMK